MNREIKFRAWNTEMKQMVHPTLKFGRNIWPCTYRRITQIDSGTKEEISTEEVSVDHILQDEEAFIVMQFTGLQDKNGVDIYEGDICVRYLDEKKLYTDGKTWKDYWLIEWLDKTAGFTTTKVSDYNVSLKNMVSVHKKQNSFSQRFHEMEVIGNIHQNPELI